MHGSPVHPSGPVQLATLLIKYPRRWLVPAAAIGLFGLIAALLHQPSWEAHQTLTTRPSMGHQNYRSGMATDAEHLKQTQETILELARSPSVVSSALARIDSKRSDTSTPPSDEKVDQTRSRIKMVPPNGSEFGTTELFYLVVEHPDRQKALDLTEAICDELEIRFREVRNQQATSLIAELSHAQAVSQKELDAATRKIAALETSVGSDLAELRLLSESNAGESNLQATLVEVQQEVRQAGTARQTTRQLLDLLLSAQQEPSHLVATPNKLLESQPALRRLKDGLIDSQLTTSRLLGTMSADHPRVQAALVAEEEIRGHLHRELELAVRGLRVELTMHEQRITDLTGQRNGLRDRLQRLAGMRAEYSNVVAETRKRAEALTEVQQDLTVARAGLAAADTTSPITRIGKPQTGPYPAGPGRTVIAAAGLVGGLFVGVGLLVLTAPTSVATNQTSPTFSPRSTASTRPGRPATAAPARTRTAPRSTPPLEPAIAATASEHTMSLTEALTQCADSSDPWN